LFAAAAVCGCLTVVLLLDSFKFWVRMFMRDA
jgi:hypothetical protein